MIDEPGGGQHYGGQVAAPAFARIAGDALRALKVAPDAPFTTLIVPADPVKESV
jgi:cell division protein FtsI (penicillin-binding protein 3)